MFHRVVQEKTKTFPNYLSDRICPERPGSSPLPPPGWLIPNHLPRETSSGRLSIFITADAAPICPSNPSIFPSLINKDPEILELLHSVIRSSPGPERIIPPFPAENQSLPSIERRWSSSATFHARLQIVATKTGGECLTNRTTSSANSRSHQTWLPPPSGGAKKFCPWHLRTEPSLLESDSNWGCVLFTASVAKRALMEAQSQTIYNTSFISDSAHFQWFHWTLQVSGGRKVLSCVFSAWIHTLTCLDMSNSVVLIVLEWPKTKIYPETDDQTPSAALNESIGGKEPLFWEKYSEI